MSVRIVVHIGPMKTGTSALAAALSSAERHGRLPAGVLYPVDDLWFERAGRLTKHSQVKDLAPLGVPERLRPREEPVDAEATFDYLTKAVAAARKRAGRHQATVVLVNETAARAADPEAVVAQLTMLADEVVIVAGVREPRAAAASVIGQGVRTWSRHNETSLSARRVLTGELRGPEHDYAALIDRWGSIAGCRLVLVPFFEDEVGGGALMARFGEAIGIGPLDAPPASARGELVHPGLERATLQRLAALKRCAAVLGWVPGARERIRVRFDAVAKAAAQRARRRPRPPFSLTGREAAWVLQHAEPSRVALCEWLGPEADSPTWSRWFAQWHSGPGAAKHTS